MNPHYSFTAKLWLYSGESTWHFVTLPEEYAAEIKSLSDPTVKGFGSVRVQANIGRSRWNTSLFPDTKRNSYLLPIKKEVRKTNSLKAGDTITISLAITQL